jgi:hypothetical protein
MNSSPHASTVPQAAKRWESFTSDGPGGAWSGTIGPGAPGLTIPLVPNGTLSHTFEPGQALAIMKGPGIGTVIPLSKLSGSVATASDYIDETIPPGGFGTVMPYRGRMAFEGKCF